MGNACLVETSLCIDSLLVCHELREEKAIVTIVGYVEEAEVC